MNDDERRKLAEIEKIQCPVCGYYCLGNGGKFCIDKKSLYEAALAAIGG